MARAEPNIFSQKCGNGWDGALASTVISRAAAGGSSGGKATEAEPTSRIVGRRKSRRKVFIGPLHPHEHSRRVWGRLPTRRLPGGWGTRSQLTALSKRK